MSDTADGMPKGAKQVFNALLDLIEQDKFYDQILRLRKQFDIPEKGHSLPDEVTELSWKLHITKEKDRQNMENIGMYLATEYDIDVLVPYSDIFCMIIVYDVFFFPHTAGLCYLDKRPLQKQRAPQYMIDKAFPIVIRVSPHASLNDVLDFVREEYRTTISTKRVGRGRNRLKIGKLRSKKKRLINDFIYENRDLPLEEIRKKLASEKTLGKDKIMDTGHIAAILSQQIKRRKTK